MPRLSRNTGIVFRKADSPRPPGPDHESVAGRLPSPPIESSSLVFTDGSCFSHKWRHARVAASAVYILAQFSFATLLPGVDQTSQRAELYAVLLALLATAGDVAIASDCQNVVAGFRLLEQVHFRLLKAECLDNRECWESRQLERDDAVSAAVATHVHIISTLRRRFSTVLPNESQNAYEENVVFPHLSKTYACTCAPRTRLRGKQNVCTCQPQSVIVAKPEHQFVQACLNQTLTPQHIDDIKHHYPIFTLAFAADPRNRKLHVDITPDRLAKCQRRLTVGLARDLLMFGTQTEWLISSEPEGPRVPWLLLFLAFCSHSPTVHTHFVQCKSLHASVCMFRSALGWIWKLQGINVLSAKHISSLQEFGLGRFSGFCGSVTFVNPVPIWFFLVRFAIARNFGEPPDCEFASIHKYHLD